MVKYAVAKLCLLNLAPVLALQNNWGLHSYHYWPMKRQPKYTACLIFVLKLRTKKHNQAIGLATLISYWLYTVFMLINALICMQSAVAPHNFWWFFKASTCALKASNSNAVKIGRLQKSLRHFEASSIILPIGIHKKTILSPKSIFLINYFISMCTIGLESDKLSHCFPIQWIVNWCIHTCTHLSKKMQTRDFNGTDIGDNQPNSLPPPFL